MKTPLTTFVLFYLKSFVIESECDASNRYNIYEEAYNIEICLAENLTLSFISVRSSNADKSNEKLIM